MAHIKPAIQSSWKDVGFITPAESVSDMKLETRDKSMVDRLALPGMVFLP